MGMHGSLPLPTRRLLSQAEAAAYCGISARAFDRTCPITPISLSREVRQDRRLLRYDVVRLNEWIDLLGGGAVEQARKKPTDGAYD